MIFDSCFVYDGSFVGLLSVVYEALWRNGLPGRIYRDTQRCNNLFVTGGIWIASDRRKSQRVWSRLRQRLSAGMIEMVVDAYRCNSEVVDNSLLRFMFKVIVSPADISKDFSDADLADLLRYSRIARSA